MVSTQKAPKRKPLLWSLFVLCFTFGLVIPSIETFNGPLSDFEGNLNLSIQYDYEIEDALEDVENYIEPTYRPWKYLTRLPDHFDARDHWPKCAPIIGHISNQGDCSSCWAVATADFISDRLCIASRGAIRTRLSARDLMDAAPGGGCQGAKVKDALKYFLKYGLVTEQCKPYPNVLSRRFGYKWYILHKQTQVGNYPQNWQDFCSNPRMDYSSNLFYGQSIRKLPNNELKIREEIYRNGSVLATMNWLNDKFKKWKNSRVYTCETAGDIFHAVRIIGWGMEKQRGELLPYWLMANSWGRDWGQKGTFKIERGHDTDCRIEDNVYAVDL